MDQTPKIPDHYVCPITLDLMRDPVIDNDGISYEKDAITGWLRTNRISPVSRNPLSISDLRPNRTLKNMIDEWVQTSNYNGTPNPDAQAIQAATQPTQIVKPVIENNPDQDKVDLKIDYDSLTGLTNFKLQGANQEGRKHIRLVLCLDNSGSMGAGANIKKPDSKEEEFTGMSVLDIVRACAKAIIESLGDNDQVAIVKFHDQAHRILNLTKMNAAGKRTANDVLMQLEPENTTNLWDGVKVSYDCLSGQQYDPNVQEAVFVLTDGQPNTHPARSYLDELTRYNRKFKDMRPTPSITTFGFGYSLATKLLCSLSDETGGRFVYIPDQGFVGTGMIHALSNTLSTQTSNLTMGVQLLGNARFKNDQQKVYGAMFNPEKNCEEINSIRIKYGDVKNFLGNIDYSRCQPGEDAVRVTLEDLSGSHDQTFKAPAANAVHFETRLNAARIALVDALSNIFTQQIRNINMNMYSAPNVGTSKKKLVPFNLGQKGQTNPKAIIEAVEKYIQKLQNSVSSDPEIFERIGKMIEDISGTPDSAGQIKEAMSSAYFAKWGQHFIPSIMRAHRNQECNNFADPGIQDYGAKMFEDLRDHINDIYDDLPPPKQSLKGQNYGRGGGNRLVTNAAPQIRMNMYNTRGGCFAGATKVVTEQGSVAIKDLKKGQTVWDPVTKKFEKVVCLLKIVSCDGVPMPMVQLSESGLKVTEYHPMMVDEINSVWAFPKVAVQQGLVSGKFYSTNEPVYNLLTSGSSFSADNVTVCTLGHGLDSPIVNHDYLGNYQKIVGDLSNYNAEGLEQGFITLNGDSFMRDQDTQAIVKIGNQVAVDVSN